MKKITLSGKRTLVIDDQKPFLAVLKGILNSLGAKSVVAASSCEIALKNCEKEKFDFIICDLHFGENKKNGFQFLEEIRFKKMLKPETIFIMVSADAERPMVLGSLERQPDEYLVKPFSQAQLELRLNKAYRKKLALYDIYAAIHKKDTEGAIQACHQALKEQPNYQDVCIRTLTELYWRTEQYVEAQKLLTSYQTKKPNLWLQTSLAQTEYLLENYVSAIELAKGVLTKNKLLVDAHDIIASSYLKLEQKREAFFTIEKAISLSPYSLERNFKACHIARENNELGNIVNYSRVIWELSRKSVHRNISHLCTHLRSYLDFAESIEDSASKSRLQQEAFNASKKYRVDEGSLKSESDFDFEIYEDILAARIDFQNDKILESQKTFAQAQIKITEKYTKFPLAMAPDSYKVMLDLGEYEEADDLLKMLQKETSNVDENTLASVSHYQGACQAKKDDFVKYNRLGIGHYDQEKYQEAIDAFTSAQKVAPANSAIALNLLQCTLRLLDKIGTQDEELVNFCKKTYRRVKNMTMLHIHRQKLDRLQIDAQKYLEM